MARKPVYGDKWSESSLERAARVGKQVYLRTLARKVPNFELEVKQSLHPQESEADCEQVSLDEAFYSVMNCLGQASHECKKYHSDKRFDKNCRDSVRHCAQFHKILQRKKNPVEGFKFGGHETLYLTLPEGAYSVTLDNPSSDVARSTTITVAEKDKSSQSIHFTL